MPIKHGEVLFRIEETKILQGAKCVRWAIGIAPWGGKIKAEIVENDPSTIMISLPELDGRPLAMLSSKQWEIWVTNRNEIHVVNRFRKDNGQRIPIPDEYIFLTKDEDA